MDEQILTSSNSKVRETGLDAPVALVCPHCKKPFLPGQLVCSACGERTLEYTAEAKKLGISDALDKELLSLQQTIVMSNAPNKDWLYPELNAQMVTMQKILNIAKHSPSRDTQSNRQIRNLANSFLRRSQYVRMEIALVGTVKSGKSSLINALIGSELASVDAVPETSVLTKYRTTKSGNYLRVRFYTNDDWKRIWRSASTAQTFLNEYDRTGAEQIRRKYLGKKAQIIRFDTLEQLQQGVMKWTKSDSPEHFFVKELEVGYRSDAFAHDVFFVDTPGLDDPVQYRSNITRRYISKSDWTLACIAAENLSQKSELSFLSRVIANRNGRTDQIFTIITKKDQLDPRELNSKKKLFLDQIAPLYGEKDMAERHTFVVSAVGHSLTMKALSHAELEQEDKRRLRKVLADLDIEFNQVETYCDNILDYAGVKALYEYLNSRSVQQARNIIVERIREDYRKCIQAIRALAETHLELDWEYMQNLIASQEKLEAQIQQTRQAKLLLQEKQEQARQLNWQLERQISASESARRYRG